MKKLSDILAAKWAQAMDEQAAADAAALWSLPPNWWADPNGASTAAAMTLEEMDRILSTLPPPLPPADPDHCAGCKFHFFKGETKFAIHVGGMFGPPAAYLCTACYDDLRRITAHGDPARQK